MLENARIRRVFSVDEQMVDSQNMERVSPAEGVASEFARAVIPTCSLEFSTTAGKSKKHCRCGTCSH